MSVVLTVKVEGLIEPPLAQMASTKACYKLGLITEFLTNDCPLMRETFRNILLCHKFLSQKNSEYSFGILGISAFRPYHSEVESLMLYVRNLSYSERGQK